MPSEAEGDSGAGVGRDVYRIEVGAKVQAFENLAYHGCAVELVL